MILAAVIVSWFAVTVSCGGGPESVAAYEVPALMIILVGWEATGPDGALNPAYVWTDLTHLVPQPAGASPETVVATTLLDPPADSVLFYPDPPRVVSIDETGNRSDACQVSP